MVFSVSSSLLIHYYFGFFSFFLFLFYYYFFLNFVTMKLPESLPSMENGNSEDARVLAGPAACNRYSGPNPPSPVKTIHILIFFFCH